MNACGGPCYTLERFIGTFDLLFNLALIEMIGVISSIVLISRVLYKKYRMRQQNIWKKNRRLLIQVLSITLLHNIILVYYVHLCVYTVYHNCGHIRLHIFLTRFFNGNRIQGTINAPTNADGRIPQPMT